MRTTFNMLSLGAAIFVAYALLRGLLPPFLKDISLPIRGLLAVATLGLGIRGYASGHMQRREGTSTCSPHRPGVIDFTIAAGALLVMHFAFLTLIATAPPLVERIAIAIEPWLRPETAAQRAEFAALTAAENDRGNWLWQDQRSRTLPQRTNLRLGNRPEVFLRFDTLADAEKVIDTSAYLKSFSLSNFVGDRWTTYNTTPTKIEANDDDSHTHFATPPARTLRGAVSHEVFHGVNRSGQNVLIALQGLESTDVRKIEKYDDGFLMLPLPAEDTQRYQYRASSRPLLLSDIPSETPVISSSTIPPNLLGLPEDNRVADHLRDQAIAISGENPTIESLKALETWMRDAFDYSLETTNPQNLDAIENFLFVEQRGHCEHFAMATALMLRTLGIPTRVAYGWSGGTWYESPRLMVFRAREAHAWVEFWLADYGWIVIDPTPPSAINGTQARIAPPGEQPPDPIEIPPSDVAPSGRFDFTALWLLGSTALPLIVLLLVRPRLHKVMHGTRLATITNVIRNDGYLGTWKACCPPRHPGETLRQQLRRIEPTPPFADTLIDYHYRTQYIEAKRDPKTERKIQRAIRAWRKQRDSVHLME